MTDPATFILGGATIAVTVLTAVLATRRASEATRSAASTAVEQTRVEAAAALAQTAATAASALAATQATAASALAATAQHAEEVKAKADAAFQDRWIAQLNRAEKRVDDLTANQAALLEKYNTLANDHARLAGQVEALTSARTLLLVENEGLKVENGVLRKKINELDDENQLQGDKLQVLTGRLTQLTGEKL